MKQSVIMAVFIAINSLGPGGVVLGAQQSKTDTAITVGLKTRHPAIVLAGDELAKYLGRMAGDPRAAVVVTEPSPKIALGLLGDFGVKVDGVADPALDDSNFELWRKRGLNWVAIAGDCGCMFAQLRRSLADVNARMKEAPANQTVSVKDQ